MKARQLTYATLTTPCRPAAGSRCTKHYHGGIRRSVLGLGLYLCPAGIRCFSLRRISWAASEAGASTHRSSLLELGWMLAYAATAEMLVALPREDIRGRGRRESPTSRILSRPLRVATDAWKTAARSAKTWCPEHGSTALKNTSGPAGWLLFRGRCRQSIGIACFLLTYSGSCGAALPSSSSDDSMPQHRLCNPSTANFRKSLVHVRPRSAQSVLPQAAHGPL